MPRLPYWYSPEEWCIVSKPVKNGSNRVRAVVGADADAPVGDREPDPVVPLGSGTHADTPHRRG